MTATQSIDIVMVLLTPIKQISQTTPEHLPFFPRFRGFFCFVLFFYEEIALLLSLEITGEVLSLEFVAHFVDVLHPY